MEQHDVERIARTALKELGLSQPDLRVAPLEGQPGTWRIDIRGNAHGARILKIKCGAGTSPQWVREQIVNQYNDR